jgi:hypothetical protein
MTYRNYVAKYAKRGLTLSIYEMPDGKIEQFIVRPAE